MGTKDVLDSRKKLVEGKAEVSKETVSPMMSPAKQETTDEGASELQMPTAEQLHNMAKNLHAVMKVVALHQHMHNEHYETHKKSHDTHEESKKHHELSHNAISKLIDDVSKKSTQGQ